MNHRRDVFVMNTDTRFARGYRQMAVGIIDGVLDIAAFEVVFDFQSSHSGAVFLGFRGRGTDMRQSDDVVNFQNFGAGEIGDVVRDCAVGDSLF